MSESDSDLDFESADEDAGFDAKVENIDASKKNTLSGDSKGNSENKPSSHGYSKNKSSAPDVSEMPSHPEGCKKEVPKKVPSLNNSKLTEDSDVKNSVDSLKESTVDDSNESKQVRDVVLEKNIESAAENSTEAAKNKTHIEKQRVPLRLEKKIQQKQKMSKEDSYESNSTNMPELTPKKPETKPSSWGFGGWGTSLLSTAASSVSTFTNQVSQGIGTVLETVESTLGAPTPEEFAATLNDQKESDTSSLDKAAEKENSTIEPEDENIPESKSSILPDMSSWTKVLENTGSKVLMGGLDTLELIGKKTIDIITEGDPGLRKKRAAFADGITLSQILREAKAEADESKLDDPDTKDTVHYSQMFDEYQGLVHLEALEMLSKQSEAKIQMLLMRIPRNSEIKKNMEEIKSICENIPPLEDPTDCEDFEDFITVCKKHILELNLNLNVENIVKTQKRIMDDLKNYSNVTAATSTPEEIYHSAICSLAEFTAKSIEIFHKLAELILIQPVLEPSVEHFATNLTGLATVMCIEINNLSSRYHKCLDSISEQCETNSSESVNFKTIVTNLYLEAENSNKYIQDAFLLLVPVLQASLLESSQ